jgi:hypothetical protein
MAAITYANKTQALAYEATKFNAQDANEIKTSVNALYDNASNVNGSLQYRVRLFQSGASAPTVQIQFLNTFNLGDPNTDPTAQGILLNRLGVGSYRLSVSCNTANELLDVKFDLSFSDAKIRQTGFGNSTTGIIRTNTFDFKSYNLAGAEADGIITFTNLYLTYYPNTV